MLISIKWLEEIFRNRLNLETLKEVALSLGLEVEDVVHKAPEHIVVGQITDMVPHKTLKDLSVLEVYTDKKIQIVTAAKNVKKGDLVLVGLAGEKFNGEIIKERDFSGTKSYGILISEQELGLEEKSTGVIVLEKGTPGILFSELFDDIVVDFSAFPNRGDWLSVQGIARELAVGLKMKPKVYADHNQMNRTGTYRIQIKDIQGCPRYTARVFDNVKVKPSPFWLKWRINCLGMKSINNVVDITNYVMLLTGQPLHPFDLELINTGIWIRRARDGECFMTLEGSRLELKEEDLVITDKEGVIALAGIIGARCSQISASTKKVLLESAYFDPRLIGKTSRRLNLITEASMRFERGVDLSMVDGASKLCAALFKKYAGAKEVQFIGAGKRAKKRTISFSLERMNEILSLKLKKNEVRSFLSRLNIGVKADKHRFIAEIPGYRNDLKIEEDIYEEVARVYGYMRIPETPPRRWSAQVERNPVVEYEEKLKNFLLGQGFSETYNLSLISSRRLEEAGYKNFVRIKNPLNERFDVLRPTLFFGMIDCVNFNLAKGNNGLKLFEIGNVFFPDSPYQETRLGVIMGGPKYPYFWNQVNQRFDYYDAKGVCEAIFEYFHVPGVKFQIIEKFGLNPVVDIVVSGKSLGCLGAIEKDLCKEPFFYFEIAIENLWSFVPETFYIPTPKYPPGIRDLSFLVDDTVEVPDIIEVISTVGGPILERVNLFDYYKGKHIPAGKKNLGFRLWFRASDRTLTDTEVNVFVTKIAREITKRFKAVLRKKE